MCMQLLMQFKYPMMVKIVLCASLAKKITFSFILQESLSILENKIIDIFPFLIDICNSLQLMSIVKCFYLK